MDVLMIQPLAKLMESPVSFLDQVDAGTFVWSRSNEIYEDDLPEENTQISTVIDDMELHVS